MTQPPRKNWPTRLCFGDVHQFIYWSKDGDRCWTRFSL